MSPLRLFISIFHSLFYLSNPERKLTFSIGWTAMSLLSFLTDEASASDTEAVILNDLANGTLHEGKKIFMSLLDYFIQKGPNGEHGCLVFDVMGPSAASMVESLPVILAEAKDILSGWPNRCFVKFSSV